MVNNRIRQYSKIFKQTNPRKYGYAITTDECHIFFVNASVNARAFCRRGKAEIDKIINEIDPLITQAFSLYGGISYEH